MSTTVTEQRPTRASGLREVAHLAWPLVLTNSCWTAQMFIDRVFLAHYDQSGRDMAATLPAVMLYWAVMNLFFHTTAYVATFVAQYHGAGRPRRIGPVVGQALYCAGIGGAFFLAAAPFTDQIVRLAGHEADLARRESVYLFCLCFAAVPTLVSAAVNNFFNGRGDTRTTLVLSVVALAVNVVLDWMMIFGRGGLPEMGLAGAGWATAIAQAAAAGLGLLIMLRAKFRKEFATGECWRFDPALFRRLLRFGVPNGLFIAIETAAFTVFTFIVGWIGTAELAATNMAFTLNMVAFLPALGIGQAVEVLVGRHLGAERPDVAENRVFAGFGFAWTLMASVALGYFLIPHVLLAPFRGDANADTVEEAAVLLRFVAFYTLFDAANLVFSFALRGAGDTRFVMRVVSFLPWLGMVLPVAAGYAVGFGLYFAWTIASAYVAVLAVVFYARFRHGAWKSMRVIEPVFNE